MNVSFPGVKDCWELSIDKKYSFCITAKCYTIGMGKQYYGYQRFNKFRIAERN